MLTAATSTFSSTVSSRKRRMVWKVRARPAAGDAGKAGLLVMSAPSTKTCPLVAGSRPVTTLIRVVLPEPLGPISPRISACSSLRLTPSRARRPAKYLVSP